MIDKELSMKAMVFMKYGPTDVLRIEKVKKPKPKDDEVLVKVHAVAINDWDWHIFRGTMLVNRMIFGLFKPRKPTIIGCDISGVVDKVGKNVKKLKKGDEVYGDLSDSGFGGFAEYAVAPEDALALKSKKMTFEEAAATPQAGLLALQGFKKGRFKKGQKVLINGAGGGVGTFIVQIAKDSGVEMTGVDKKNKLKFMTSMGYDHVIDYQKTDFTRTGKRYDLIIDNMSTRTFISLKRALKPKGRCLVVGGHLGLILSSFIFGRFGSRKVGILALKTNEGLDEMTELFEAGKVKPVIDSTYPLSEAPEAFRHYGKGKFKGKVIITVCVE
jgi:NADPH:quinone reductase-like Zn-dependent oxidoreductase